MSKTRLNGNRKRKIKKTKTFDSFDVTLHDVGMIVFVDKSR